MWWALLIVVILLLAVIVWYRPQLVLEPLNALLRLDPVARPLIYGSAELQSLFPAHTELESLWREVRVEAEQLLKRRRDHYLQHLNLDIGGEDLSDWAAVPLRLWGWDRVELADCPVLQRFLNSHPEVESCLISEIGVGKVIAPHHGPWDGLLRYQLALRIPVGDCRLRVGGVEYRWTEGAGLLFDETLEHSVTNNTAESRLVLLLDLRRPYRSGWSRTLNSAVLTLFSYIGTLL